MFPSSSAHGVLDHSNSCDGYLSEDASLSASRTHPLFGSFFHFSPAIDHADPFLPHDTPDLLATHFHHPIFSPRANTSGSDHVVVDIPTEPVAAHGKDDMPEMNFFLPRNLNSSNSHLGAGRKRSVGMKKDRHSKILTAQGPRDRRMRLSLEVASKFFNLQNMLGFDTGSKTVGWLLSKSEAAIRELYLATSQTKGGKSVCSPSDGEVVSGIDDNQDLLQDSEERSLAAAAAGMNPKAKKARSSKRMTPLHPLAKEWRAVARARARERTRMKSSNEKSKKWVDGNLVDQPKTFKLGNLGGFSGLSSAEAANSNDLVSFPNNDMISIFREHWNHIDHGTRTASAFDAAAAAAAANIHSTSYAQEQVSNPLLEMTVGSRLPFQFTNI
ncbi:hypothetical protein ACLOJK_007412 [Asimina triloba]